MNSEGQDPYAVMIRQMIEMQKELDKLNSNLQQASVRSHMLNIDVATMFNPETEEMLQMCVEDCEKCSKNAASLTEKSQKDKEK